MFEWKSGDDDEWVEKPTAVPKNNASRLSGKIRIILAGFVLALIALSGLWLAYRQVNTQVTAVTGSLEQEVLAADRLLVDTALADDTELFAALLRRSPTWVDIQTGLQARGALFDRPALGLWLDTRTDLFAAESLSTTQFIFSPDLNTADLTIPMSYVTVDEKGEIQPLTLQRTAVYHRQDSQSSWLLTEPDDAFWGDYVHEKRQYLDLITPARDQEIAAHLADDLNDWIARICDNIKCPPNLVIQLRLSNNAQSLLELLSPVRFSTVYVGGKQTTRLSLPAPTLVGLPVDETSYAILLRGYATHLAQALLNAYSTDTAPAVVGGSISNPDFDRLLVGWGLFIPWPTGYNPIVAAEPPPIPLPEQDILMLCYGSRAPNLFRYDTATEVWSDIPLHTEGALGYSVTPFPDGEGAALVIGPSTRDGLYRVVWLHDGREYLLFTSSYQPLVQSITELEPGRFLLYYTIINPVDANSAFSTFNTMTGQAVIVSAADCDDTNCSVQPFTEWNLLSPDGRHSLLTRLDESEGFVYALGNIDGEEIQPLGNIKNPFWLDGRTLVYLETIPTAGSDLPAESRLMKAVFANDSDDVTIQPLLTAEDVRTALPDARLPRNLLILGVVAYPEEEPDKLFVVAGNLSGQVQTSFLLQYDWHNHIITTLPELNDDSLYLFWASLAPNGRYLTVAGYENSSKLLFLLYDIADQSWQSFEGASSRLDLGRQPAWSADGNWLVLLDLDAVRLVAPQLNYEKLLFHGLDFCETAFWVNKASIAEPGP